MPQNIDKQQALHQFFGGFGLDARDENTVPDDAMTRFGGKYLTYGVTTAALDEPVSLYANLWYRDTSWAEITSMANSISEAIGIGGVVIPYDGGYLWVCRGVPFAQRLDSGDSTIRRIYINLRAEYLSAD
jgi:hypothetical protein